MGGRHTLADQPADSATFTGVLRQPVFAGLFVAEIQSMVGDQLARVALSVLVFEMTGSAPATAATYAATLLPAILGGVVLARIGDRFSRRRVMIACDLFRAACFAAMVIPGMPIGVMIALVVVAVVAGPVFSAAQVSTLAAALGDEQFRAANGMRMIATQAAQVGGFVFGGLLVALLGTRPTLALDAATFVVSALLVQWACRSDRGAAARVSAERPVTSPGLVGPWRDRHVRNLVALSLLLGFFVVPEGLAVPLGDELGASPWQVGALLAAGALGGSLGALFIVRGVRPRHRTRVSGVMAVGCGIPLLVTPFTTSWQVVAAAWLASGFLAAYVVEANTAAIRAVPDVARASFVGTLGALLLAVQGIGLIGFGLLAQWTSVPRAIAVAGAAGSILAMVVARAVLYTDRRVDLTGRRPRRRPAIPAR